MSSRKEYRRKYQQRRRALLKSRGLCTVCGHIPPAPDRTLCTSCAKVNRIRGRRHYNKRKAQSLCTRCGKSVALGKAQCQVCAQKQYAPVLARKFSGNHLLAIRRDKTICRLCGKAKRLQVHHIDGNGIASSIPNDSLDNLITLCTSCHFRITRFRELPLERRRLMAQLLLA